MPLASPVSTTCVGADDPPAFDPQPIRGDASFGRLLSRRRELDDQRHKGRRLDADDARTTLSALGDDRPLVVAFFARWCQPCRDELAQLQRLRERMPAGVRVVAVSLDEGPASRAIATAQ